LLILTIIDKVFLPLCSNLLTTPKTFFLEKNEKYSYFGIVFASMKKAPNLSAFSF